jgi:transcriptional regulator with PAS, ATPase and Fis domain
MNNYVHYNHKEYLNLITKYHKLSNKYNVNPDTEFLFSVSDKNAIKEKFIEKKLLIECAIPYLQSLYQYVKGTGFFLELLSEDGTILYFIGDSDVIQRAEEVGMTKGTNMNLRNTGTNAISIALEENCAIQLLGKDHYLTIFQEFTCSAAPIHDLNNKIIGCINLNGWKNKVHKHTLGLVVAAATSIEQHMDNLIKKSELFDAYEYINTIVNSIENGIIGIDDSGKIRLINETACKMLNESKNNIINTHFSTYFVSGNVLYHQIKNKPKNENLEATIKKSNKNTLIESNKVFSENQQFSGCVLLIKDIKKIMRLVDRYTENTANYTFDQIIGESTTILNIKNYCKEISNSPSTVLIQGESGTGKELFAQAIHNNSNRKNYPFVAINCGAIPKDLIESELFGYVEGAFTGAKKGGYSGKFVMADKGTLFLDEIGEMPLHMQVNLLRVIQENYITRLGDSNPIKINVRIIAATNKDLKEEIKQHRFREDLYYRLNVIPIYLPPLRERSEDLSLLIDYFLTRKSQLLNKPKPLLSNDDYNKLLNYSWPGNIRELENTIENVVNFNGKLNFDLISETQSKKNNINTVEMSNNSAIYIDEIITLKEAEKLQILHALELCNANYSETAKKLGINRTTLYNKIKKYNLGNC